MSVYFLGKWIEQGFLVFRSPTATYITVAWSLMALGTAQVWILRQRLKCDHTGTILEGHLSQPTAKALLEFVSMNITRMQENNPSSEKPTLHIGVNRFRKAYVGCASSHFQSMCNRLSLLLPRICLQVEAKMKEGIHHQNQ